MTSTAELSSPASANTALTRGVVDPDVLDEIEAVLRRILGT